METKTKPKWQEERPPAWKIRVAWVLGAVMALAMTGLVVFIIVFVLPHLDPH